MARATLAAKFFMQVLKKARHGTITITFPDGSTDTYGEGALTANLKLNTWTVIDELVNKADLGLAESIIEGNIEVDNVAALVEWACRNDQALGQTLHGTWIECK